MKQYCIGIDLGGTNIKVGLFTRDGKLYAEQRSSTDAAKGSEIVLHNITRTVTTLLDKTQISLREIACLGIGVPGLLDRASGRSIFSPNFTDWENVPVKSFLEQTFQIPAFVDNDVRMNLYGEWYRGAGQGVDHFVLVAIGTGLGAGVVVDGNILYGATGSAGEIGHMNMIRNGRPCRCGSTGCLGRYVSALGLLRTAREKLVPGTRSLLLDWTDGNPESMTAKMISDAFDQKDPVACSAMEETGTMLGYGLVNVINLYNPQRVIISGGVSAAGERLLAPTRKVVAEHALPLSRNVCQIMLGALGDSAGMVGAAEYAKRQIGQS